MEASSTGEKSNFGKLCGVQAPGHENDDWCHAEHTYICYADGHRSETYRRQTENQDTDTGCKVQKTPGPPDACMNQPTRGRLKRSFHTSGPLKGETLSYWTIYPNPSHQSRPSPLGNDNSRECARVCRQRLSI